MKAEEIKLQLGVVLEQWMESRIESLRRSNPNINPVSLNYVTKGLRNLVHKSEEKIGGMIDKVMLFAADENGQVDVGTLLDDAIKIVKNSKPAERVVGPLSLQMGGGNILRVEITDPIVSFLMGGTTAINVSEEDVRELASLMVG